MARDENERKKTNDEDTAKEEKEKQEKGKQKKRRKSSVNKSEPAKSLRQGKLTKPGSAYSATSSISGRVLPSIEGCSGGSIRIVSGNAVRTVGSEKPAQFRKSKALPVPSVWKPTPTKTSILREKAIKLARDAKLKASSIKATKTGSPTRSAGFGFPRASPSRSLVPTPEKDRRSATSIFEDDQKPGDLEDQEDKRDSSSESSGSSKPAKYQRKNNYPLQDQEDNSRGMDPIFAHQPLPGPARRSLYRDSTEDSETFSSEWSVEVSPSRRLRKRSNTPRSPSANQNDEFSTCVTSQLERSPSRKEQPSVIRQEYCRSESPSPRSRRMGKQSSSSSGRTLVNSPAWMPSFQPPFEDFGSGHEYYEALKNSPVRVGPKSATLSTCIPQKEVGSSLRSRPSGKLFHTISPQARKHNKACPPYANEESSNEDEPSKVKPILTIGRAEGRRKRGSESRDSVKSVRWDPAVLAVGRRITSTAEVKLGLEDLEPPNQNSGDFPDGFLEDYLNNVTQSFAKLKKNNPKIINQILAALRGLKSDDESSTDTESRKKKQLNTKSVSRTITAIITPGEKIEAESTFSEPPEPVDRTILARGNLMPLIGHLKKLNIAETRDSKHEKLADTTKDQRWGEVHPSILSESPKRPIECHDISDQEGESPKLCTEALRSPFQTPPNIIISNKSGQEKVPPISAGSIKFRCQSPPKDEKRGMMGNPIPTKLNPLAPIFQGLSNTKAKIECSKSDEFPTLPDQPRLWAPHLKQSWWEGDNSLAPAKGAMAEATRPEAHGQNSPRKLDPKDAIWISTSQYIPDDFDYQLGSASTDSGQTSNPNNDNQIAPIPCPPQIFQIPPGYIPLVPYSNFLPPTIPYLPQLKGPIFPPPGRPPRPGPEGIAAPDLEEPFPGLFDELSEDQPGREAKRLERSWSEKTLARFQARYPLTGTRLATPAPVPVPISTQSILALPKVEEVPKAPVTILVPPPASVGKIPILQSAVAEQPGLHIRALPKYRKKHGSHPQQLARRQRASVIQMELEMKILDYKEKQAVKKKELEKKLIDSVARSFSMARSQSQGQTAVSNPAPVATETTSGTATEWPSLPGWKKWIECLPEEQYQTEIPGQAPPISPSEELLKGPAGAPKHVWEYLSLGLSESRPFAQAQGLSRFDSGTPLLIGPSKQTLFDVIEEMQLLRNQAIAKSQEDNPTIVATPREGQRATSNSSWKRLTIEDLRGGSMVDRKSREAQSSHTRSISRESQSVKNVATDKKSWEIFSAEEWKNSPPTESMGSSMSSTTKAIGDSLPNYPAGMIKKSFEIFSRGEIQDQSSLKEDLLIQSTPASEASLPNQLATVESQEEGIVLPKSVPRHGTEAKIENAWELLSVEEWRSQASGKSQPIVSRQPTTRSASEGSFRAPSYFWDFLNLEFNPGEFASLDAKFPQSPRSTSRTSSGALSEGVIEPHKSFCLSKPKHRRYQAQSCSKESASMATSRFSMESVESPHRQIRLDFDWVPPMRARTIDISFDNSDLMLGALTSSSENSKGKSIAMTEGSAVEEAKSSRAKSMEYSSRVSSATSISTGMPMDLGNGGETEYNHDDDDDEMF